ncbi:unnamed protein product [Lampetra planeri]
MVPLDGPALKPRAGIRFAHKTRLRVPGAWASPRRPIGARRRDARADWLARGATPGLATHGARYCDAEESRAGGAKTRSGAALRPARPTCGGGSGVVTTLAPICTKTRICTALQSVLRSEFRVPSRIRARSRIRAVEPHSGFRKREPKMEAHGEPWASGRLRVTSPCPPCPPVSLSPFPPASPPRPPASPCLPVSPCPSSGPLMLAVPSEFPCTVDCCHSVYSSMRKLQVHMMAHTYGRPYRCTWDDCGWSFTSSYKLKRHFVSHEKQRPFVCEEADCGKRFSTVYNLKAHRRAHGAGVTGAPACLLCGAAFATPARLAAHQRVHAEPRRPHLCDFPGCEKTFSTANALGAHRRSHARARELFVCSYPGCGKTYDKACRLTLHLRSHTGERPFTCEHEGCGWTFTCMSKLLRHKRKHADERRFACREPGCGKTFTRAEHLKGHTITHSGTRPFTCDVQGCGARFSARSSLYVHSRKHGAGGDGEGGEGLRSQCPVATCGKLFASVHSVKAHMMKLHNVSPAQFALLEQSGCLVPACDPDDDPSGGSVDPKLLTSDLSSSCLTATSDPLSGGGSPPSYGDDVLTVDGTAIGGGARGRLCRTSPQDTKRGGAGGSGSPAGQGLAQGGAAPAERRRQHQQQHGVEDQGGAAAATASTETTGVICPGLLGSLCMKLESTATLGAELPSPPPSFAGAEAGTVLAAGGHDTCAMRQSSVALSHTPLSLEMLPSSLPPAACAEAQALGLLAPLGGGGEQAKALAPVFCGLGSLSPGEVDMALASVQALLESGGSARTDYRSVQLAKHRKRKIGAAPYSAGASGKKKSKSSRAVTAGVTGAYSSTLALQDPGSTGAHYLQVQILQDEAGGEGDLSFGLGSQGPHSSHSTDLPVHILQASCAAGEEEVGDFGLVHPGSSQFPGSTINLQDLE